MIVATFVVLLFLQFEPIANAQSCAEWNLNSDFRLSPLQENPNRDSCGNMSVWYFMESSSVTYPAHLPPTYTLLGEFINDAFAVPGLQQWQGSVVSNGVKDKLSAVGINATGSLQMPFGAIKWDAGVIRVHPFSNRYVVIGWRSPVTGTVRLSGGVRDLDSSCGNGISWSVDRFDGAANATLASGAFSEGGNQTFQGGVGGANLDVIAISQGDFIYVLIDPKATDYFCDSTALTLTIQSVSAGVSGISSMSGAMLVVLAAALALIGVLSVRAAAN